MLPSVIDRIALHRSAMCAAALGAIPMSGGTVPTPNECWPGQHLPFLRDIVIVNLWNQRLRVGVEALEILKTAWSGYREMLGMGKAEHETIVGVRSRFISQGRKRIRGSPRRCCCPDAMTLQRFQVACEINLGAFLAATTGPPQAGRHVPLRREVWTAYPTRGEQRPTLQHRNLIGI